MARWFRRGQGATSGVASGFELLLGMTLVGTAALAGLFFIHRPWPASVDVLGFRLLPANYVSGWAHDVTHLGSLPALLVGAPALFVVGLWRDWLRGIACAAGPLLAALIVHEAKPLVDRHLSGVGAPSYPSGTVAVVAALATASVLVVPPLLKAVTALAAVIVVAAACAAVVVLRWHFPTDALGGVGVGAGIVLVLDGLLHLGRLWLGARLRPAPQS